MHVLSAVGLALFASLVCAQNYTSTTPASVTDAAGLTANATSYSPFNGNGASTTYPSVQQPSQSQQGPSDSVSICLPKEFVKSMMEYPRTVASSLLEILKTHIDSMKGGANVNNNSLGRSRRSLGMERRPFSLELHALCVKLSSSIDQLSDSCKKVEVADVPQPAIKTISPESTTTASPEQPAVTDSVMSSEAKPKDGAKESRPIRYRLVEVTDSPLSYDQEPPKASSVKQPEMLVKHEGEGHAYGREDQHDGKREKRSPALGVLHPDIIVDPMLDVNIADGSAVDGVNRSKRSLFNCTANSSGALDCVPLPEPTTEPSIPNVSTLPAQPIPQFRDQQTPSAVGGAAAILGRFIAAGQRGFHGLADAVV